MSFHNRDAYANPADVEEVYIIEDDESEVTAIQQQSTQQATSQKSMKHEVFINLPKNQRKAKGPPAGVSEPLYDAYIDLLDVEYPITEEEAKPVPDQSIWDLATLPAPNRDSDDDITMKNNPAKWVLPSCMQISLAK